jgi:hypothetical protein
MSHSSLTGFRTIRVFYQTEELRNEAHEMVTDVKDYMLFAAMDAMRVLSDEFASPEEQELAMKVNSLLYFCDRNNDLVCSNFCFS